MHKHVCAVLLLVSATQASTLITTPVDFQTSGQSMWGAGGTQSLDFRQDLFSAGNPSINGSIGAIANRRIGSFGAQLSVSGSWGVGLGFHAEFSPGNVSADVPVQYFLTLPDSRSIAPGQSFTIGSKYSLSPSSQLTTQAPTGSWDVFVHAEASATVTARACLFGCVSGSGSASLRTGDVKLFGATSGSSGLGFNGPAGLSASLGSPAVNTSGSLSGAKIVSAGNSQFASVGFDFTSFLQTLTGIPFSVSLDLGFAGVGLDLLKLTAGATFSALQRFEFTPVPMIDLDINGQHHVFRAGQSVMVTMPQSGPLTIVLRYYLANTFSSDTDFVLDGTLDLDILQAWARLLRWRRTVGPLVDEHWDIELGSLDISSWTGELGGFNEVNGSAITLYASPEPGTLSTMAAALAAVWILRRRRH